MFVEIVELVEIAETGKKGNRKQRTYDSAWIKVLRQI